jgi:hypothetical protein
MIFIEIILRFIAALFYLLIIFIFIKLRRKIAGRLKKSINLLILAIFFAIIIRTLEILDNGYILYGVPYLQGSLMILLSIIVFISIFNLYKGINEIIEKKKKKRKK